MLQNGIHKLQPLYNEYGFVPRKVPITVEVSPSNEVLVASMSSPLNSPSAALISLRKISSAVEMVPLSSVKLQKIENVSH